MKSSKSVKSKSSGGQLEMICYHKALGSNELDQKHREEVLHQNSDSLC